MKKITYVLSFAIALSLIFSSCEKDKKKSSGVVNDPAVDEAIGTAYGDLDTTEVKASLENYGVTFADKMDGLVDEPAVDVAANLIGLMEGMSSYSSIAKPVYALAGAKNGVSKSTIEGLLNPYAVGAEDLMDFKAQWDSIKGTYTWNPSIEDFDKTTNASAVVIKFPGLETDNTNTAVLTINNFAVTDLTKPLPGMDEEDMELANMITSLKIALVYNSSTILSAEYSSTLQPNAIPTALDASITIGDYNFTVGLEHTPYSKAELTWTFKVAGTTILELFQGGMGNWSQENIDANIETKTETYTYGDYTETWEYTEFYFENVLTSANAYVQILDVRIAGIVDVKTLGTNVRAIEDANEDKEWTLALDKEEATKIAAELNNNAQLVVVDTKNKIKLAEAEAYAKLYEDEYWEDYDIAINFVFADGSKVDAETYFEGFDQTFAAFEDMVLTIEDMFGGSDEQYQY